MNLITPPCAEFHTRNQLAGQRNTIELSVLFVVQSQIGTHNVSQTL